MGELIPQLLEVTWPANVALQIEATVCDRCCLQLPFCGQTERITRPPPVRSCRMIHRCRGYVGMTGTNFHILSRRSDVATKDNDGAARESISALLARLPTIQA